MEEIAQLRHQLPQVTLNQRLLKQQKPELTPIIVQTQCRAAYRTRPRKRRRIHPHIPVPI